MPEIATRSAPLVLICALIVGATTPVSAESPGCGDQPCANRTSGPVQELAAQTRRPRVTIYRRRASLPPNAVRQCRSWLAREYRVSGPVIVPQMYCWWEY